MINIIGKKSRQELVGVHSDMVIVVAGVYEICGDKGLDLSVFDGIRTKAEQKEIVESGASWTMNSQHIKQATGYGHAVDLVPYIAGKLRFDAIRSLKVIGKAAKKVGKHHGIPIIWGALKKYGGDWSRRNDMYHIELNRRFY